MNADRMTEKANPRPKKAYSMRFRFLATLILAILAITILIGGLSIYEVDKYIQTQAEDFVKVTCTNESEQINESLENMEKSVKIMESYLMDFFGSKADVENRALMEQVIERADQMFIDVTKHTSTDGAIAYYFRPDPAIAGSTAGLFYSKIDGGDEFISLTPTDISLYDKDDTEHVGWFWQPYEAGEPIWMQPYYNQNNNSLMISYIIPMYFEDKFIGVVGMDFDYVVLSNRVRGIEIYDNGFAYLATDGDVNMSGDPELEAEIKQHARRYLRVSEELTNGMTLVLAASYENIRQIRYNITFEIVFAVLLVSALFTAVAIFVVKKIVDPLKNLTDAASKLSDGDYNIEIEPSDTQEIKLLGAAFENMTVKLREREELLRLSANRDSLTGLRNTTSYASWVAQFDTKIANEYVTFGVIMLDLNDLKKTNDAYGHEMGDKLIVTAAKIISDIFKRSPVFRIGGDEFLVVLQGADLENREELLDALTSACESTYIADTHEPIGIALGISLFEHGRDARFADVFKRADRAMYENKRQMKS